MRLLYAMTRNACSQHPVFISRGIILFAMLNGRLPFNDSQLMEMEEDMKMQRLRFERIVSFGKLFIHIYSHWIGGNQKQKSLETVFSIAICRQSGDKWQSKSLFLMIFDLRSWIVFNIFDCRLSGVLLQITAFSCHYTNKKTPKHTHLKTLLLKESRYSIKAIKIVIHIRPHWTAAIPL